MLFRRRKNSPSAQRLEEAIKSFFKQQRTSAIGTHGTTSKALELIRQEGLAPSSERFGQGRRGPYGTYFRMTKGAILRILRREGRQSLYRKFVNEIGGNLYYSESKLTERPFGSPAPAVYLTNFGLVVGKVPSRFFEPFGEITTGEIPKEKIFMTITLSKQDLDYLKKRFPEFQGWYSTAHKPWLPREEMEKERIRQEKLKTEIAKIFSRKIITELLGSKKT